MFPQIILTINKFNKIIGAGKVKGIWKICDECSSAIASRYCKSCRAWICDDCLKDHYYEKHLRKHMRKAEVSY